MKAHTKRKIKHTLLKKKVVKKKSAQHILHLALIALLFASVTSLTVAVASNPAPEVSLSYGTYSRLKPQAPEKDAPVSQAPAAYDQAGKASWYALGLPAPDSLTCASTKYPRGTYLEVTSLKNGRKVICRVNDYGPEAWTKRVIDLSRGSFRVLDGLGTGILEVKIKVVPKPSRLKDTSPLDFSQVLGYGLCRQMHTSSYCEQNRHSGKPLR